MPNAQTIAPNDIAKRREEIDLLIADDDLAQMAKRLIDFVREFTEDKDDRNEAIVISANCARLEVRERKRLLGYSELAQERDRILYQALELADRIVQQLSLSVQQ